MHMGLHDMCCMFTAQNFEACKEAILEAAELYAEEKDKDKVSFTIRDSVLVHCMCL